MNPALKAPLKFVLAFAAVIAFGIVLYIGAVLNVYAIAFVVKLISAIFG
jgi:hypothetical protein